MKRATGTPMSTLITYHNPMAAPSEAFRILRTNLQFLGLDKPLKSIVVTSATPAEGKSTVTANLAVVFAQNGSRVCLVDADLRRPMVSKMFGVENWAGLTSAVIGQGRLEESLQSTVIKGLSVLTSGPIPPNPSELLGSARMGAILAELEREFDIVLIDSPPVLAVTDAAVLAPRVGGVLLVVHSGEVGRQQVIRAKQALQAVQANVLGAVLHGVQPQGKNDYYYYHYYGPKETASPQ